MERNRVLILAIVFLVIYLILSSLLLLKVTKKSDYQMTRVMFNNNVELECYLADTMIKQTKGLSVFDSIGEDQAMLFTYSNSKNRSIWMKDMKFLIDIIWLDDAKKIVKIDQGLKPESYPEKFFSNQPINYFIETNAGWARKNNLKVNQYVSF